MSIRKLWENYLQSGIEETSLHGDRVRIAFVNAFSLVGISSFIFFGSAHIAWERVFVGAVEVAFGCIGLLNVIALRLHKKVAIATLVILGVMYTALIFLFITGGYGGTGIFWFATFPILAIFLRGKREGSFWIGAFFLGLILLWVAKTVGIVVLPFNHVEIRQLLFSLTAVSILILLYQNVDEGNSVRFAEKEEELADVNEQIRLQLVKASEAKKKLESFTQESINIKKAVLNILEDVQEEKQKVEVISARFDRATKSAKIGVFEWNVGNNSLSANEEFYGLYGVDKEQFTDAYKGWMRYIHPDDKKRVEKEVQEALASKDELNLVVRALLQDESVRFFKVISKINRGADGKPLSLVGVEWDITREKEAEKAIGEFVSIASHQLRTPMTAISWVAEMLGKKEQLTDQGKKYLNDILLSTKRLSKLVDMLLNVSRLEDNRVVMAPQKVEIISMIQEYLSECEPLGEVKGISITFPMHPKALTVVTDAAAFRNIVQAIVSNAIEYTPKGGSITISVDENKDKTFTFKVSDTGIGIPKAEQKKIFTKFVRASNAQLVKTDGTGLGMYIAWQATKLLGGNITFESVEGKGTTFIVILPLESRVNLDSQKQLGKSLA